MNSELLNAVSKTVTGTNVIILPGYGKPKVVQKHHKKVPDIYPKTAEGSIRVADNIGYKNSQRWIYLALLEME